jgi:hypothetical protein
MAAGLKQAPPRRLSSKLCASRQARSALHADGASPDPLFASELSDPIGAVTAPVAVDVKRAAFQADDRLLALRATHAGEDTQETIWLR